MRFAAFKSSSFFIVCLAFCFTRSLATAQESESRPNTIAFNVRMDQLMKHKQILPMMRVEKNDETFTQIDSIKGIASLPEDFNEIAQPENRDDPPFDFYLQIEMKEDFSETQLFKQFESQGKKLRELDGTQFYSPSPNSKSEIAFDGKTITMYSAGHRYLQGKLPKMTPKLEKSFQQKRQSDAMIAIDFKEQRELISSIGEFGKENMPPMAEPYLDMLKKLEAGLASIKAENDATIIEIRIDCSSEEDANRLEQMLEELIQIAKASMGEGGDGEATIKMLDSLKSRVVGKSVEGTMSLGSGFEKASQRAELSNNAKQTVLGMHNFFSAYNRFPFQAGENENDQISWRVKMLPFIAQGELFEKFDLSKPWDSPENKKLLDQMPKVFGDGNKTNLCWIKSDVGNFADIKRGSSNTIAFVYSDRYVPWTENNDVTPDDVLKQYKNLKPGEHIIATMYDGSVRVIAAGMEPEKFEELLHPVERQQNEK